MLRLWYTADMSTISVREIERDPRAFLHRIEEGEAFLVVRGEQPLAEVKPAASPAVERRPFGLCAGQFVTPADFDELLPAQSLTEFEAP